MKRIILEDGKPPQFVGQWTVGEVLAMADALARWVQSLAVNVAPEQEPQEHPHAAKE
jgi:hypothetical protein